MNITVLISSSPTEPLSPVIGDMVNALESRGARVTQVHAGEIDADREPLGDADVCVLKAKSSAALTLGRRFHEAGVQTVSPYPVTALCRDKLATNMVLDASGLPIPRCLTITRPGDLVPLLEDIPAELGDAEVFAQRYYAPDGLDRKIYRIGDAIFCVQRVWPPRTLEDKLGRLIDLEPHIERIARACGDVLGTDVYGVDVIEHNGTPWVVDLSRARLAERILSGAEVPR